VKEQSREYLTLVEVAERYRTTPATVRYWRHCGRGPRGVRIGTRVLYPSARSSGSTASYSPAPANRLPGPGGDPPCRIKQRLPGDDAAPEGRQSASGTGCSACREGVFLAGQVPLSR
jgi:hypothetical protein